MLIAADVLNHKVEQGNLFDVSDRGTGIQSATPQYWLFRAPATGWTHIHVLATVEAGAVIEFYESPTTSADGDSVQIRNRNRNHQDTNGTAFFRDPTVDTDGTLLFSRHQGGSGNAGEQTAGTVQTETKFILKVDTDYAFKVIADADGLGATLELEFFETEAL